MKFDMSAAWRDATAMIAANREVMVIVAGLFFFLPSVALGFAMGDSRTTMLADPASAERAMVDLYSQWWWLFAVRILSAMIGYLTLLALLRDEGRPTVGQALKTALTGVLPAIGAYLIFSLALGLLAGIVLTAVTASGSGVAIAIGVLLCFAAFIYVGVKFSLSGPVIAIDKVMNPIKVLIRSWRLTKGNSVRLFGFFLLLVIAYIVLSIVGGVLVSLLLLVAGRSVGLILNALLTGLLSAAATTVLVACLAAAHRQLAGPSAAALGQTFE